MDHRKSELLYDMVADRVASVLRWSGDNESTANDLVMHLSPSELIDALHAAHLLDLGPEADHLRQAHCEICGETDVPTRRVHDADPRAPQIICADTRACYVRCSDQAWEVTRG
jgi:hypothetical protein